ncbi:hypothetical protein VaNZ11_012984, partial [Volvox africanus]
RRAALALASAKDGPEGPYSMLASALGDVLHRHEAEAVAELRHPVTKTLRVKQLLHEGAPTDALLPHGMIHGSALQLGGSGGLGGVSTAPGAAPGTEGAGFLRVVKGKYDIVVVLDLPSLLQTHGHRHSGGAQGGQVLAPTTMPAVVDPTGPLAVSARGAAAAMLLQTSLSTGVIGASGITSATNLSGVGSRGPLARSTSDLTTGMEPGLMLGAGGGGSGPLTLLSSTMAAAAGGLFSPSGVVLAPATTALVSGVVEGFPELALRAFPGPSAGAQLRRAIVVHLASLPRRSQPWTHLGVFVAGSQAHLWLKPANRWPKLKAFVMHPDSRGAFLDVQLPGAGGATGGLVALDPTALRRAATSGLTAAITAAWPGQAPLERIRRAAAFTLAFAVRGPAGPHTMLGSALGTAIRKRDKEAFDALAGVGKLSELLDDTAAGAPTAGGGSGTGSGAAGRESGGGASSADAAERESSDGDGGAGRSSSGGGSVGACGLSNSGSGGGGGGGGGGSGGGSGSGYIISFKKDQDGYMRLRLEALLMEWPKEEDVGTANAAAGGGTGGLTITSGAAAAGAPLASALCANTGASMLSLPATTDCSSTTNSTANDLTGLYNGGSGAPLELPSSLVALTPAGFSGPLTPTALSGVAALPPGGGVGSGAGGGPISDVGSPPLEQELMRRFPPPPGAPAGSEQVTIAAAKRCIARLLAWAPPPHQLTFAKLGAQVPKLLGGARIGRNLRLICLEEPDVFAVQSQSPTVYVVRLVCPRLLQLALEQSERKHASSQHPHPTFQQPQLPTNQPPPPPPPHQQPQPTAHTLPPVVQVLMPQQHAVLQKSLQLAMQPGQPGQIGVGIAGGGGALTTQLQQLQLHQPQGQQMQGLVGVSARGGTCTEQPLQNPLISSHPSSHPQLQIASVPQRLLLQPQGQGPELEQDTQQQQQPYIRTATQLVSSAGSASGDLGRAGATTTTTWSTTWQQQPQQQQLLLLQQQSQTQGPQQQQQVGISTLRHQSSLGSNNGGGGTARLYDDRLSLSGSTPRPSLSSVGSLGGRDGFSASNLSLDSAQLTSWHGGGGAVGGGGGSESRNRRATAPRLRRCRSGRRTGAAAATCANAWWRRNGGGMAQHFPRPYPVESVLSGFPRRHAALPRLCTNRDCRASVRRTSCARVVVRSVSNGDGGWCW